MGTPELFLEHRKGERTQKILRVKPDSDLFVIGSSRDANLRLRGEGVQGVHAALRFRAPHWYVCDLSGSESLKVNDQVVAEAAIDGTAKVEIAGHRIQLFTKNTQTELFRESETGRGQLGLHQVVIRSKSGRVIETHLLGAKDPFIYRYGEATGSLAAPLNGSWVRTQVGSRLIQQRLVANQELVKAEELNFDRDMRRPLVMSLLLFVLLASTVGIVSWLTKSEKPEVVLDQKSQDIIFNAKAIEKKRIEAKKVLKTAKAKAGGNSENAPVAQTAKSMPEESMAPKASTKPSAALTSIRQAGLNNLIGKIAKRANKQGVMVAAVGTSPDTLGSGRAIFSTGNSTVGGGGTAAKEGPTYRLGGVATKGKAGGIGNFKDGTALAGGSIGSGEIVAMVDDETVIEGGLDRDAIAEVIRRNLGQIRYCYERQLSSNPDLYGKVLMRWTIGADGLVTEPKVGSSTLKSDMVEGCMLRRLASWKFPLPKGGTTVNVSYPFLFKATD